eukprot:Skav217284  [mRNA]  locus=scaffold120:230347:253497:+ [translate_table: standard]
MLQNHALHARSLLVDACQALVAKALDTLSLITLSHGLQAVAFFHVAFFAAAIWRDVQMRKQAGGLRASRISAFALVISMYSVGCCLLGTAYIASASDEDVILTVLVEPLVKSWLAARLAGISMQERVLLTTLGRQLQANPKADVRAIIAHKRSQCVAWLQHRPLPPPLPIRSAEATAPRRLDESTSNRLQEWIAGLNLPDVSRNEMYAVLSAGFDKSEIEYLMEQWNFARRVCMFDDDEEDDEFGQVELAPLPEFAKRNAGLRAAASCARKDSKHRPVDVVFLSDGEPSDEQDMLNTVQLELLPTRTRQKELAVHCIGFGSGVSAAASGAVREHPPMGRGARHDDDKDVAQMRSEARCHHFPPAVALSKAVPCRLGDLVQASDCAVCETFSLAGKMFLLVSLFAIAAAVRFDSRLSSSFEEQGSKTTCQYRVERGRPEARDGTFRRTHWKNILKHYKDQDFLQCRALCDGMPQCVAFVRRATDDVGYLGVSRTSLRAVNDDPTKALEAPI